MKNASNDSVLLIGGRRATLLIGTSTRLNFASCMFFSITRLVPFSLTTRSSFGRLKAAVCTPRLPSPAVKTTLTTRMGASAPSCGLRYFGIDRQGVLELLQVRGERLQLFRFGFVADGDERFERRLEVEPLVLVDLVGPMVGSIDASSSIHATSLA